MGEERARRSKSLWTAFAVVVFALLLVSTVSAGSVIPTPISDDPYTDGGSAHQHKTQVEPDSFALGQTIVALTQSGRWYGGGGSSNLVFSTLAERWPHVDDRRPARHDGQCDSSRPVAADQRPVDRVRPRRTTSGSRSGSASTQSGDGHILLVNRSTDGGLTWSNPVVAGTAPGTFWDKTWIGCDTLGRRARTTATATSSSMTTAPATW